MNLIKINWTDIKEPSSDCRYSHVIGCHPLGKFSIEWKGWKESDDYTCYFNEDYTYNGYSLDEAKEFSQKYIDDLILKCLEN